MADTKISALTAITGANLAAGDLLPIADVSAAETKSVRLDELHKILTGLLKLYNPANTFLVQILPGAETADRVLAIPVMGGNRTMSLLELAQTYTAQRNITPGAAEHGLVVSMPGAAGSFNAFSGGGASIRDDGIIRAPDTAGFRTTNDRAFLLGTGVSLANNVAVQFSEDTTAYGTKDSGLARSEAGVVMATDGGVINKRWLLDAGPRRKTAAETNDSATLADDTHLRWTLLATGKHSFEMMLTGTTGAVLEGIKAALSGTATITHLNADVLIWSHAASPVFTPGNITAFNAAIGQTVTDAGRFTVKISGSFESNAAGTFGLAWAKNADTGAANTTLEQGSWGRVWRNSN